MASRVARSQLAMATGARKTIVVGTLVLALLSVHGRAPSQPAGDSALAPFKAHFTAEWKSLSVGTSDIELKPDADAGPDAVAGRFIYTWSLSARGIFRLAYEDVNQKSWVSIEVAHVRPQKYHAIQGEAAVNIDFDWDAGHARGVDDSKPVDVVLVAGTQDVMSIQLEVMLGLKHGNLPKNFKILDKDEIKDFIYTQEPPARIRTALGELDTLVVASQRNGSNRLLRMWFAPSLGYVPVQAERTRDGKLEFAMRIETLQP